MKTTVLTILALFLYTFSNAQENSLLWKISGNGQADDSYVFGTLHMACSADFQIPKKVIAAIAAAEALVFEVDVTKPENVALIQSKMAPNPNFFSGLSAEKKKAIDSVLLANEIPPAIFDQVSPVAIISLLAIKGFDCTSIQDIKMMEAELKNLPEANGKPIQELESATFQIDLLDSLFSAEDLYTYLISDASGKAYTKQLVKAYFSEHLQEIEKMTSNTALLSKENQEKLLDKRNQLWIEKMPFMMKEQSLVFAVGAGHLVGERGIIQLLRDKGYTVTPVMN